MALAVMLKEKKVDFIALTVDHGMRKESALEAKSIAVQMQKMGVAHTTLKVKAKPPASNKMEWARKERYGLLLDYCTKNNIQKLYVAHHLDDQIETFFLNLERGSGLRGLSGMRASSKMEDVEIIRPLLNTPKSELAAYLKKHKIKHYEDPTNQKLDYKRNRLRAMLEQVFPDNLELLQRIGQAMEHLAQAEEFIAAETEKAFATVTHKNTIDAAAFLLLHPLLQYRVLVKLLMQLSRKSKPPRADSIRNVLSLMNNRGRAFTLHGIKAKYTKDKWVFTPEEKIAKALKSR